MSKNQDIEMIICKCLTMTTATKSILLCPHPVRVLSLNYQRHNYSNILIIKRYLKFNDYEVNL